MNTTFLCNPLFSSSYLLNSHQLQFGTKPSQIQPKPQNITQTQVPKATNSVYRQEVLEWFGARHVDPVTVSFTHSGTVHLIIKMYQFDTLKQPSTHSMFEKSQSPSRFPNVIQELERKCFNRPIKAEDLHIYETQQKLMSQLRLFDCETLFDSIMITKPIAEIISLCEQASDGNAFQSQPKVIFNQQTKQYTANDSVWFVPFSYQNCAHWVVNELEKAIAIIHRIVKNKKFPDPHEEVLTRFSELQVMWGSLEKNQKGKLIAKGGTYGRSLKNTYQATGTFEKFKQKVKESGEWIKNLDDETKWVLNLLPYEKKIENTLFQDVNLLDLTDLIESCMFVPLEKTTINTSFALKKLFKDIMLLHKEKIRQELIKNEQNAKKQKNPPKKLKKKKRLDKKEEKEKTKEKEKEKEKEIGKEEITIESENRVQEASELDESKQTQHVVIDTTCSLREVDRSQPIESNETSEALSTSSRTPYPQNCLSDQQRQNRASLFTPPSSPANLTRSTMIKASQELFIDSQHDTHDEGIPPKRKMQRKPKQRNRKKSFSNDVKETPKPLDEIKQFACDILSNLDLVCEKEEAIDPELMLQAQSKLEDRLNRDLVQFTQNLLCECDKLLQFRKLIFNRIQFVVKNVFKDYDTDVRLYGSCATGMALPDSDIDIGVIGLEMIPKSQLHIPIQMLEAVLSEINWVSNIAPIFTSSVPVLKLEVNPFVPMDQYQKRMPTYFQRILAEYDTTFLDSQIPCPFEKLTFKVDVTINQYCGLIDSEYQFEHSVTSDNLGQLSTEMVLQWSTYYKELQYLVLFFKMLLKRRGLNQSYKGGLSSFCTILMVLAFIEYYYQNNTQQNIGATFYQMLDFYGNQFDTQKQGISFFGFGQSPFFPINFEYPVPIQILSPLSNEIISSSCAFIQLILQDLKYMHQAANEEKLKIYERLSKKKRIRKPIKEPNFILVELEKLTPIFGTCQQN